QSGLPQFVLMPELAQYREGVGLCRSLRPRVAIEPAEFWRVAEVDERLLACRLSVRIGCRDVGRLHLSDLLQDRVRLPGWQIAVKRRLSSAASTSARRRPSAHTGK